MAHAATKQTCFVIGPIGEAGTPIRKRADDLLECVIAPAVSECDFANPMRSDQIAEPGLITHQIVEKLIEADLVIADLEGRNANVFYELAVRHVARKPVIMLANTTADLPFDVNQMRTIFVDMSDVRSATLAKNQIIENIRSMKGQTEDLSNPVLAALATLELKRSTRPGDTANAQIIEAILDLRNEVASDRMRNEAIMHSIREEFRRLTARNAQGFDAHAWHNFQRPLLGSSDRDADVIHYLAGMSPEARKRLFEACLDSGFVSRGRSPVDGASEGSANVLGVYASA